MGPARLSNVKNSPYYPIFLDLDDRKVVIVGGGVVSARKAGHLMKYGARVTVIAPDIAEEIGLWAAEGRLSVQQRPYHQGVLEGATLVIASTDSQSVNGQVAADCRARGIPVNVVDDTALCDFIVPAVLESGSVQIAISTGGKSPALARTLKNDLQSVIGPEYAEVNDIFGGLRDEARRALPTDAGRKRFFEDLLARGILQMLREGRRREAYQVVVQACRTAGVPLTEQLRARATDPGGEPVPPA